MPASQIRDIDSLLMLLATGHVTATDPQRAALREAVGQLDHGLQCAHELALATPDDEELQVAGLLHDIGHLLVPGDDAGHGRHAADAVRPLLGHRVAGLIEAHVPAKRYLVAQSAGYGRKLSDVSTHTLGNQGGPMTPDEAAAFRSMPEFPDALVLRQADDAAKLPGRLVLGLDYWRPIVRRVAARNGLLVAGSAE